MRFKAHYFEQKPTTQKRDEYWRTVYADSVNEATKLAERFTNKGYCLGAIIQDLGKD